MFTDLITLDMTGFLLGTTEAGNEEDYPGAAQPRAAYVAATERPAYTPAQERE